jgi:hypothetical protein
MASPENSNPIERLLDVERQLERANEIENPIERLAIREKLFEQVDNLQAEIEEAAPSPEQP